MLLHTESCPCPCPILIPSAQGTGSPGGRSLPSCFCSTQGPLVATGHLTLRSRGSWLLRPGLSARWHQQCPALGAPSTALVLCSCRELPLLRLPVQIQGLLLPDGVGRAGDKGPPDTLHGLLQGPGWCPEEEGGYSSISGSTGVTLPVCLSPVPVGMTREGSGEVAQWAPHPPHTPQCWLRSPPALQGRVWLS